MKKLVVVLVLVLLLAGGGAGAAYFLGYLPNPLLMAHPPGPDGTGGGAGEPIETVEMEVFNVTVIRDGSIGPFVTVAVTFECKDKNARINVYRQLPRIRDAFVQDFHAVLPLRPDGPAFLESPFMQRRLQRIAARIVGPEAIRSVWIESPPRLNLNPENAEQDEADAEHRG